MIYYFVCHNIDLTKIIRNPNHQDLYIALVTYPSAAELSSNFIWFSREKINHINRVTLKLQIIALKLLSFFNRQSKK